MSSDVRHDDEQPAVGDRRGAPSSRLGLLVISDVRLYRDGVGRLLGGEPHLRVACATGDAVANLDGVGSRAPDVVLLDTAMPYGVRVIRAVRTRWPGARVIVLTVSDVDGELLQFAEVGIAGYVTRDGSVAELLASIDSATRGEALCSPRAAAALFERVAVLAAEPSRSAAGPPDHERVTAPRGLTGREAEILRLIDAGMSNKEIGARLFIGVPTVKTHVHNILRKLGASRRGEAAARARAGV